MSQPPDILIVVDRSASMNDMIDGTTCTNGCGALSKWALVTTAISQVLPTEELAISWGLKLFASPTSNSCLVSNGVELAPQPMNAAMIVAKIGMVAAGSSTPTTAAILSAAVYLTSLTDGAPKFILLVTDGMPTCGTAPCVGGTVMNQCDDANAIAAVKTAHDSGVPAFVVGVGTATGADATLTAMAVAGGFPRAGNPPYYPADSVDELTAAFTAIAARAKP